MNLLGNLVIYNESLKANQTKFIERSLSQLNLNSHVNYHQLFFVLYDVRLTDVPRLTRTFEFVFVFSFIIAFYSSELLKYLGLKYLGIGGK